MTKNAVELLKEDHEKVEGLLKELTETTVRAEKSRVELLTKIEEEILIHARIEEEIFYPAFRESDGQEHERMFHEAKEEHRAVEELILPDLLDTSPTSEQFSGRAKVLKEMVKHHADEEEEEMFPKAEKSLSSEELKELGERMKARKDELKRQFRAGGARTKTA